VSVYVTDTHPLLWYSAETYHKLSRDALRVFRKASRGEALIWIPAMAIWEAGMLERIRRVQFRLQFRDWVASLTSQPGFAFAPLDADVVESAIAVQQSLDVFDVGVLATAKAKDLPLITKDTAIVESGAVEILW
jgi:PIN domain nuclease of toxin-antitoxin system